MCTASICDWEASAELGLPAIQALNLLTQVDTLEKTPVPKQFPGLFTGLGTIQESFKIQLKPDDQPFALFTPRNFSIPLRKKVRDELTLMNPLELSHKWRHPHHGVQAGFSCLRNLGQSAYVWTSDH